MLIEGKWAGRRGDGQKQSSKGFGLDLEEKKEGREKNLKGVKKRLGDCGAGQVALLIIVVFDCYCCIWIVMLSFGFSDGEEGLMIGVGDVMNAGGDLLIFE